MSVLKEKNIEEKLNKISKDSIELYLDIMNYGGLEFSNKDNNIYISSLEKIYNINFDQKFPHNVLTVNDQNDNKIIESNKNSCGIIQLLYELEVFADIPLEIINKISKKGWIDFVMRFIKIYQDLGWVVLFSKESAFTDLLSTKIKNKMSLNVEDLRNKSNFKYVIINNGDGGKIDKFYSENKHNKRIETLRLIVLFRAFLSELLCHFFKNKLIKKNVYLRTLNWNWALINPLYPNIFASSKDIDDRKTHSVYYISNNETQFDKFLKDIYGDKYDINYIREVMNIPNRLKIENGLIEHENRQGKNLNVLCGERKTVGQPKEFEHTVYLMGGCVFFGYAVEDSQTIASYLQKTLNKNLANKKWRVVNFGTWGGDIDWTYKRFYNIKFNPGDLVLVSYAGLMPIGENWEQNDISICLKSIKSSKDFYFNGIVHCNKLGYKKVAENIFSLFYDVFNTASTCKAPFRLQNRYKENNSYDIQLKSYIRQTKKYFKGFKGKNVGAIVMNCNPFTLGHQYLIEYAAKKVEELIVFVVQEDRSFFPFKDRFTLVKKGTSRLKNVFVVPSGNMIISTVTFPGYFLKDTPDAVKLDPSEDVRIFGEYIAKAFNISCRFLGKEPFDKVTKNYNESMKTLLPFYNVKVVEIDRKENQNGIISASRVRKLLKEKKFDEIKSIVPRTTFDYLLKRFS